MNRKWIERRARAAAVAASLLILCPLIACQDAAEPNTDATLESARTLIGEGKVAEGLELMRDLVEANPDDARIQALYGEALMASGQPSLAVWPLSRAMRDPGQLVYAGLLLAQSQIMAGSGVDAIRTTTRVLEVEPENEDALMLRVRAHLDENLEERALDDLDRAEQIGVAKPTLDLLRLDALLGLGREKDAEVLLAQLTEDAEALRDDDPATAARLCAATATFTFERGDVEGAKKRFDACLEDDGIRHGVIFDAAVEFFDGHGEVERATELFKRRFELDPKHLGSRVLYADRLQRIGETGKGEALLLEAVEEQKAAWAALADLYAIGGDVRKAVDALDKAIEANPDKREDWRFSRADFLLALGELDEAEKTLATIELPAHRELLSGRIAAARGELESAAKHFEEGIRLWPDNPDARYLAARVYERLGEWKKAADHYREAARMDTPHYQSSLALADLQRSLGDTEGVSFLLLRLAEKHPYDAKVMEELIEFAADTNAAELGVRMLTRLSSIRGKAGRAVRLAAERMQATEGPEPALAVIDKTGLDLADPLHVEALGARVRLLVELGRVDEARRSIETALDRTPDSPELLLLRAELASQTGDAPAAVADLERVRALAPTDLPALLELARLRAAAGETEVARRLYAEAIPLESELEKKGFRAGESKAAVALAQLELDAGEVEAARARLRAMLAEDPRHGGAAWLLLKSYAGDGGVGSKLPDAERRDLALRAAVFDGSPEAEDYWKRLKAEQG